MNSIRRKLFIQLGSIMILFILLLFIANTFLLEGLYIRKTKGNITDIYDSVNTMDIDDYAPANLYNLLVDIGIFADLVIMDTENNTAYLPSNPIIDDLERSKPTPKIMNNPPINALQVIDREQIDENSEFVHFTDIKTNAQFIMYDGLLDNGLKINVRVPLNSIGENVSFLNQFILGAGILILIISILAANIIAKNFTRPILKMSKVTGNIKRLDFSKTCDVLTNDELGQLAENINEMSYSLKNNIENLASSNAQLTEEIKERMKIDEQRKDLLNNVSHELKTPLSIVQGYSEGLKINLHKNPEKSDFYCDVIIDEAKKMDMLVSQLLDINHIQFGDFPLHKETTDARDFIGYILTKYQPMIQDAGIDFTQDLSTLNRADPLLINTQANVINLSIDALRSEQMLTNLLNNALAYVDDSKKISLTASLMTKESAGNKAKVSTLKNPAHSHLRITVSNSYEPVPDSELEQWWNSFYKVDKARTRKDGGYGLGLSIIRAIQESESNSYGVYYEKGQIHFFIDLDIAE